MESIIKEMLIIEINNILKEFSLSINKYLNNTVLNFAYTDLKSFAERDPSSNHDMLYILKSYRSYHAVLIYRIAHSLFLNGNKLYARKLSEYGKIYTGIEIHPNANIGKYFVLDHGVGTVIGETTIIAGYVLNDNKIILFFDGKSLLDFENVSIYINNHKQTIINMQKKFIEIIYIKNINTKNIKIYSQDNLLRIDFDLRI